MTWIWRSNVAAGIVLLTLGATLVGVTPLTSAAPPTSSITHEYLGPLVAWGSTAKVQSCLEGTLSEPSPAPACIAVHWGQSASYRVRDNREGSDINVRTWFEDAAGNRLGANHEACGGAGYLAPAGAAYFFAIPLDNSDSLSDRWVCASGHQGMPTRGFVTLNVWT